MAKEKFIFEFRHEDGTSYGTVTVSANNVQEAAIVANTQKKQWFDKETAKKIKTVRTRKKVQ